MAVLKVCAYQSVDGEYRVGLIADFDIKAGEIVGMTYEAAVQMASDLEAAALTIETCEDDPGAAGLDN